MQQRAPAKKVAVLLFDVDNCLYTAEFKNCKTDAEVREQLLTKHKKMLEKQVAELKVGGYDKVIIANFSMRQYSQFHKYPDTLPSMTLLFPVLQAYFAEQLSCEVLFDPILMEDLLYKTAVGDSYVSSLENKPEDNLPILDKTKSSLTFLHCHRAARNNPEAKEIDLKLFDDNYSVSLGLQKEFFEKYSFLLPDQCTVTPIEYDGSCLTVEEDFHGTGPTLTAYDWATRYFLIQTANLKCSVIPTFEKTKPLAPQLEKIYQESGWFLKKGNMLTIGGDNLDAHTSDSLKNFKEKDFLEMKSTFTAPGYITAQVLLAKGLISPALLGLPPTKETTPSKKELRTAYFDAPCSFLRAQSRAVLKESSDEKPAMSRSL